LIFVFVQLLNAKVMSWTDKKTPTMDLANLMRHCQIAVWVEPPVGSSTHQTGVNYWS